MTYSLHGNRSHLFRLRLGIDRQSTRCGGEQHLERVHPLDIRRYGHDRDDPTTEPLGGGIRSVVADDDRRPPFARLRTDDRVEVDQSNFTAKHQITRDRCW
jgi:hypothetical protein